MTEFNLRALIREVAADSKAADPGAVAEEVARRISAKQLRAAFLEMLRPFVVQTLSQHRLITVPPQHHEAPRHSTPQPPASSGRPGTRSWKRDGVRDHWAKVLQERVHVGVGPTDWKFLGDCDADDCLFISAERRRLAEANLAAAQKFDALAKLLTKHKVQTVRELPRDALTDHLGEAA